MAKLNVAGDVQGGFVTFLSPFISQALGERTKYFVPIKSLLDANVLVVGSSDAPVEPTNPLYGIRGAVVRTPVMNEAECITLDQALKLYTVNAQKLIRNDHRKGYLKPGYIADITVFEDNLFDVGPETLFERKVAATIVDGKIAFRKNQ
jgi:predicted amidohydrolase YtcJ